MSTWQRRVRASALLVASAVSVALWAGHGTHGGADLPPNAVRVDGSGYPAVPCAEVAAEAPLVLLVLGQSNAGNHGAGPPGGRTVVTITDNGLCRNSPDPLPGATGNGASIWTHLPQALAEAGVKRPLVLGVLAIDASTISQWNDRTGSIRALLSATVGQMVAKGLPPALVIWQHGEADSMKKTSSRDYAIGMRALAAQLREAGLDAPIALAKSTVCRSKPSEDLRSAVDSLVAGSSAFLAGADTDQLTRDGHRSDGCHFAPSGLKSAAALWAQVLKDRVH